MRPRLASEQRRDAYGLPEVQKPVLAHEEETLMLSALPISILWQVNLLGDIHVGNQPKNIKKNDLVAGPNTRRLMQLRAEANREMSLQELLGQAEPENAGASLQEVAQRPIMSKMENCPPGLSPVFVTDSKKSVKSASPVLKPSGPLSERLIGRLLGRSPLRLVIKREARFIPPDTQPSFWIETLICGHVQDAYIVFYWDSGGHLIQSYPSAKRRRCVPCKEAELAELAEQSIPKKPVQSVREIPEKKAKESL